MPEVKVNGHVYEARSPVGTTLADVLRDELSLTGTKVACGEGHCGACTVLVNGEPVKSCAVQVSAVAGKEVTTIEGLAQGGKLHPVQRAFMEHDAFQCGFCTSGMIMKAVGFLAKNHNPSDAEIVSGMESNLCRCGAHCRIVSAVGTAAKEIREGRR